ncbi:TPA: hypothetical protein MD831_004693 [Klebsiella pneumoniae]|nr:hypothetical protein [Klebsiella pneumoniae]
MSVYASRYTGFLGVMMKYISFRMDNDNYNRLEKILLQSSRMNPARFFSSMAYRIASGKVEESNQTPASNEQLNHVRQIRFSDVMLEKLTYRANQHGWHVSKEIRFLLDLAMTEEPVLLDEELAELRLARNAVNTVGRNLSTIIRNRDYADVSHESLWEDVKRLTREVETVKKAVRKLTNSAVNIRSVKLRNEPKG